MTRDNPEYHKSGASPVLTWLLSGAIVAMGVVLFHFQGNTTDVATFGSSAVVWMVRKWDEAGGTMSHGWLIPIVSGWFVWLRRKDIAAAERRTSMAGLAVVVLSLLLHVVGLRIQQSRLALFSMIGLIWGIPFYIYGRQMARLLVFPAAYLLFCVPWNFLDQLTFPLRMLASAASASVLNGLGVGTLQVGTALYSTTPGGFQLDVADPCSGLRSLLAIMALTSAYAWATQKTMVKKWLLFVLSVPIALLANIARIVIIALLFGVLDGELAHSLTHDTSGYMVFIIAVLLVAAVGGLFEIDLKGRLRKWRNAHTLPTS